MSFLPLSEFTAGRQAGDMNVARRISRIISECNEAQRHLTIRRMALDSHLSRPDVAPETYAEFLARTSSPLLKEPTARQRRAGRTVH
jgi:hypothetical protein